tara:strand:- start:189 stop:389 length:201 start_codon:yes stop_codon:yes gene_type:complete
MPLHWLLVRRVSSRKSLLIEKCLARSVRANGLSAQVSWGCHGGGGLGGSAGDGGGAIPLQKNGFRS